MANKLIAPERVIDKKLYDVLLTLKQTKDECGILFATYAYQGVNVCRSDEGDLYKDMEDCINSMTHLAVSKYIFDLEKEVLNDR